jgi:AcrR family transcriptional regulator
VSVSAVPVAAWAERAAERSPSVRRSGSRSVRQATLIVEAARRLVAEKGDRFTTQELVREAGVALQTFYRHFAAKDQLLLAVIEDMVGEQAARYEQAASDLADPVARLHSYVTAPLRSLERDRTRRAGPQFVTAQHWRLQQLYPDDLARAIRPFTELVLREVNAAAAAGKLHPADPEHDAWLVTELVLAAYHHHAFATDGDAGVDRAADRVWSFCLRALGGVAS